MPITFNMNDGTIQSWSSTTTVSAPVLGGGGNTTSVRVAGNAPSADPPGFYGPENITSAVLTGDELTALLALNFLPAPLAANPPASVMVGDQLAKAIFQAIQVQTIQNLLNGSGQ